MKQYLLPAADIIAYCLMPTHYHLMIRVKPAPQTSGACKAPEVSAPQISPVSLGMLRLSVSYTKAINKRFGRSGVLFQGRFQAKAIADSGHLIHLCCYIHGNPVKDGLVNEPSRWPYSNYLDWIGERGGRMIDREFIWSQFAGPDAYKDMVRNYLATCRLPEPLVKHLDGFEA